FLLPAATPTSQLKLTALSYYLGYLQTRICRLRLLEPQPAQAAYVGFYGELFPAAHSERHVVHVISHLLQPKLSGDHSQGRRLDHRHGQMVRAYAAPGRRA